MLDFNDEPTSKTRKAKGGGTDAAREKAREEALKRLEEESRKPVTDRKVPEFGSDKDFQLMQAINQLKGKPVLVSKTQVERKEEVKEN